MKDIKSLYETAKSSGKQEDVFAYTEAVQELLESKPIDFLSNLEYIITSDIGLSRLNEFVEKYGLSIAVYDDIVACLESCIEKCNRQKKDSSLYEEYLEKYEMFKSQYSNCFAMFESESDNLDIKKYVNTYYEFNESGIQNNKLLVGMIKEFGESAIADALVTADRIGEKAVEQTFKYLESYEPETMSKTYFNQWIVECAEDLLVEASHGDLRFDFRIGIDVKTGHLIKLVYSLDNSELTVDELLAEYDGLGLTNKNKKKLMQAKRAKDPNFGKDKKRSGINVEEIGYHSNEYFRVGRNKDMKDNLTDEGRKHIEDLKKADLEKSKKQIKKTGNTDHRSSNQLVLAIEDMVNNKRLKEVTIIGPFVPHHLKESDIQRIGAKKLEDAIKMLTRENRIPADIAREIAKSPNERTFHNVAGEIDTVASYKSTYLAKDLSEITRNEDFTFGRGEQAKKQAKTDYGIDPKTGKHIIPKKEIPFKVQQHDFIKNMEKEGKYNRNQNIKESVTSIFENSLETTVESIIERDQEYYRESVIMGNPEPDLTYTAEEVEVIRDLISFREYQVTATDDPVVAYEYQQQVYDLYEKFGDAIIEFEEAEIEEDVADSVVPMLPQSGGIGPAHDFEEDMSLMNTTNKKNGNAPGWISQNHDVDWGEDETPKKNSDDGDKDPEDYMRQSAIKGNDDSSSSDDNDDEDQANLTPSDKNSGYWYPQVINYNYNTNSNNSYSNSHNHSTDSHNVDNSVDNRRVSDDHSTNKHVNSHNDNTDDHHNDDHSHDDHSKHDDHHEESAISDLLQLDIPGGNNSFF